jgi:hypothetical protein
MTVWVYVDTSKQVGDKEHLKIFASEKAAETWLQENDPEAWRFSMRSWSEDRRLCTTFSRGAF